MYDYALVIMPTINIYAGPSVSTTNKNIINARYVRTANPVNSTYTTNCVVAFDCASH